MKKGPCITDEEWSCSSCSAGDFWTLPDPCRLPTLNLKDSVCLASKRYLCWTDPSEVFRSFSASSVSVQVLTTPWVDVSCDPYSLRELIRQIYLREKYGNLFKLSHHCLLTSTTWFSFASPFAENRSLFACSIIWLTYSGYTVLRIVKKYWRSGSLFFAYSSWRNWLISGSSLNLG